jgi:hypothetical protein
MTFWQPIRKKGWSSSYCTPAAVEGFNFLYICAPYLYKWSQPWGEGCPARGWWFEELQWAILMRSSECGIHKNSAKIGWSSYFLGDIKSNLRRLLYYKNF